MNKDIKKEPQVIEVPERVSRLVNEDIMPVKEQNWTVYNMFAMWMSNVHSVAAYVFAASLFALGLSGWQVFSALIVGITLIFYFTNWAGSAGQKYGIAFAAACRPSFGVFGANIPSMIKACTATAWYGIQTYVASAALVVVALKFIPGLESLTQSGFLGLSLLGWICFFIMWVSQISVFYFGWETIRKFTDWAGPAVYVVMFILSGWIMWKSNWDINFTLSSQMLSGWQAVGMWLAAVAFTVNWFAGTTLNFADFARFSKSEKVMKKGNFWGLPINFSLFALVTVITTSGALTVYGELITDPVHLVAKIDHVTAALLGAATFMIATIATNIVANFVSSAMDLANLAPTKLNFRRAGMLSAIVSILIMPWKLYSDPVMVQYTLGVLGSFIGPIFGIVIIDYFIVRNKYININDLYSDSPSGQYWYTKGFNLKAIYSLVSAGVIAVSAAMLPFFESIAPFSWFIGASLGAAFYYITSHSKIADYRAESIAKEMV